MGKGEGGGEEANLGGGGGGMRRGKGLRPKPKTEKGYISLGMSKRMSKRIS